MARGAVLGLAGWAIVGCARAPAAGLGGPDRTCSPPPAAPAGVVAARLVGASEPGPPPRVDRFILGDAWGCAQFGRRWQCWQAGRPGEAVRAWNVPWMDSLHLEAHADRACAETGGEVHCWDPPRPDDRGPHERPLRDGLDPRSGLVAGVPDNPFFEIGRYHACAERKGGGDVYCWGRDDVGQLGAPAHDLCELGGERVPCARTAQKVDVAPSHAFFKLGDLFTCAGGPNGISCWGASRDGFFGGAPCPESLRRAWPGLHGPIAAPDARCSLTPRLVQSATGFFPTLILYFEAGPRGVCSTYLGGLRCSGAIPTPALAGLRNVHVSPGDDASACATDLAGVACWGEDYSPPGSPAHPVLIAFEPVLTAGAAIAADSSKEDDWGPGCAIHGRCRVGSPTWPYCPPCTEARSWSDVAAHAPELTGQRIRVRGPLGLDSTRITTMLLCESDDPHRPCCNDVSTRVVLGAGDRAIQVGPYGCGGDESRLCCSVPALGESVVVSGRLGRGSGDGKLGLFEVEACVDR